MFLALSFSVVRFGADSYLSLEGFTYLTGENSSAVIYGYDNRNKDVIVPQMLGSYYVTEIGKHAFLNNTDIKSVNFANATHLRKIGDLAFSNCTNITLVVIPSSLNELSFASFQKCSSLTSVVIYSNLKTIPEQAFYNCTSLSSIYIPESVSSIENYAFGNCSSLNKITIPKATTSIASNAFTNCSNLTLNVYNDSYAHKYAAENGIHYELIPEHEIGDVDMSGIVDIRDATLIQSYAASIKSLSDYQLSIADVNGDGVVNVTDATQIQRILADLA